MKRYVVRGPLKFDGHARGEEFTAQLDPARELRLIRSGIIDLVPETVIPPAAPVAATTAHRRRRKAPSS